MKWFACLLGLAVLAANPAAASANEKTISISKVESATILSVRKLSEADLRRDQSRGWALFSTAMIGGVLGFQHGGGSAYDVKSVLNSVLRHNNKTASKTELESAGKIRLFEIQVTISDGSRKTILIANNNTIYRSKDKIRLVHFETGVFIDKIQ